MGMGGMGQVEVKPNRGATGEAISGAVQGMEFRWIEQRVFGEQLIALGAVDCVRVSAAAGGIAARVSLRVNSL